MNKSIFHILLALVLSVSTLACSVAISGCNNKKSKAEKPISILAIGSSYLRNSMDHVYPVLQSLGYDEIILGNIYSSGCKIEKHIENITNDTPFYEYRIVIDGKLQHKPVEGSNKKYDGGAHNAGVGECYKMSDALNERNWDYIIINQGATEGHIKETYEKLPQYYNYVKSQVPNTKILFNVPWTFALNCYILYHSHADIQAAVDACGSGTWKEKQQVHYNMILDCVETEVKALDFYKIIPQVTVMANCRTSKLEENKITYDPNTYGHATEGFGRYMLSLCLVSCVTGEDISNITYKPDGVTEEEKVIAIESVVNALNKPDEITQSQYVD